MPDPVPLCANRVHRENDIPARYVDKRRRTHPERLEIARVELIVEAQIAV
jgi:hypothetical protein